MSEFPHTSWTLISVAQREDAAGEAARSAFSELYFEPIRATLERLFRNSSQDAAYHTNEFFYKKVLCGQLLSAADRNKGAFRYYLLRALKYYSLDVLRTNQLKLERERSLDDEDKPLVLTDDPWPELEPVFHIEWIRNLLEKSISIVAEQCRSQGQEIHLELFTSYYLGPDGEAPSWDELGRPHGLDQKKARSRAETVLRQLRQVTETILIEQTGSKQAAQDELSTLLALMENAR